MRPRYLMDRKSNPLTTTFTLPIAEARTKAREIINCGARDGLIPVVENRRQRSDGQSKSLFGAFLPQAMIDFRNSSLSPASLRASSHSPGSKATDLKSPAWV